MTAPSAREVNTPGIFGHVLWIAVSIVSYGMLLGLFGGSGIPGVFGTTLLVVVFGWVYAVPIGVVGALVVYGLCRSVPDQGVHVAIASGCGLAGGAFFWGAIAHTWPFGTPALLVGVAAGLGRAAVIPLVDRRRTAVDHDFPAAR